MSFGPTLARVRKARGVLQRDLAEQLGVAVSTFSAWESETDPREPGAAHLRDLCRILSVSADVLLERVAFQLGPMPDEPAKVPEETP